MLEWDCYLVQQWLICNNRDFFFFTEKILLFKEIYYTLIYKISQDSMTFSNTFLMFMITLDWKFGLKIK